jgi:alkylhydroperoxidase family enzyme
MSSPLVTAALLAGALGSVTLGRIDAAKPTPAEAAKRFTYRGLDTRLTTPRLAPLLARDWTAEMKAAAAKANAGDGANDNFRIALHNPELARAWWDWLRFSHDNPGTRANQLNALPLVDKELIVLRTNYLNNDDWVWAVHVPMAIAWGRTKEEVARIAKGPDAPGWNEKDRALVRAADELHYQAFVTDRTWNTLTKYYNSRQMLDLVFMAGTYTTNAYFANSVGIPFAPGMKMNAQDVVWSLPKDGYKPTRAEAAKMYPYRGREMRLKKPRLPEVLAKDWTPEQKAAAAKANAGDGSNANFRTAIHNPELARAWWDWLRFVHDNPGTRGRAGDALPHIDKELLVMRTNYLNNDDWVWTTHIPMAINWGRTKEEVARIARGPDAPGWNEKDAALVRAADELHYQAFISDQTWNTLTKHYNTRQMLDIVFMAGVYATNAYFANSTGIPFTPKLLEAGPSAWMLPSY